MTETMTATMKTATRLTGKSWGRAPSVDSPTLTAYESGVWRALLGLKLPGGATRDMWRGYRDAGTEEAT